MIAGTHLAFASALYLGGAALFEYPPDPVSWGLAGATSLLPDIDLPTSRLGRTLFWASTRLERRFGHRTLTHSALALAAVALLAAPLLLFKPLWFWSVVGGYWSHLWADMLNPRGTDLFWPSPLRVVMPARQRHRLEVGGKGERVLLSALTVACLALYPVSGLGFRVGLMWLIADFDMAREEYLKRAGTRWYTLKLKATDNLTLERIECQCPVLGVWREGLVVLHEGRPRAVGKSQIHHNLYPLSARLIEGEPLRVLPHRVDMRGHSLRWLLGRVDPGRRYFVHGEMRIGGKAKEPVADIELYHPATLSGDVLRLHYARASEVQSYLDLVAAQGEVYVQFWLKPGEPPAELRFADDRLEDPIPRLLKGHLMD
jgi:inner membrane protein